MKTTKKLILAILCACSMTLSAHAQQAVNGDAMVAYAIDFLGVPYVEHTLDLEGPEELVLNCDEMDCTTFVEYVLAEALCPVVDGDISESEFAQNVVNIRYRDGKINGYTSRLHYISDWINNGVRNGFLEDITAQKSQDTQQLNLNYMSTHPQEYKQLANSPENVATMKRIEESLTGQTIHYLPKDKVPYNGLSWIKNGDIIAITTNTPGLDIAHMGIAFYADGKLTLIHASSKEGKVVASTTTLTQMLQDNGKWTGIRVLRMKK